MKLKEKLTAVKYKEFTVIQRDLFSCFYTTPK